MIIRKANIEDLPQILALLKLCIRHMDGRGLKQWPDWYPNREIILNDITKNALFVAEEKDQIAGIVCLSPEVPEEYRTVHWGLNPKKINSVHRLAVSPLWQKKGVSQKLMRKVETVAIEKGYDCIRLDTYSLNKAANKFYKKLNYNYCGDINLEFMPEKYHCYEKSLLV